MQLKKKKNICVFLKKKHLCFFQKKTLVFFCKNKHDLKKNFFFFTSLLTVHAPESDGGRQTGEENEDGRGQHLAIEAVQQITGVLGHPDPEVLNHSVEGSAHPLEGVTLGGLLGIPQRGPLLHNNFWGWGSGCKAMEGLGERKRWREKRDGRKKGHCLICDRESLTRTPKWHWHSSLELLFYNGTGTLY